MYRKWKYADQASAWEAKARRHAQRGWRRPKYNVPVNIIEHETEFEVRVHALTFAKEDIKISVVEDTLYISGSRTHEGDPSPHFLLQEYPIKSFERSFELSHRVDKSKISARHEHGVLVVTVAKASAAMQPEINIDIE